MAQMLKMAVQKGGHRGEGSLALLGVCGIAAKNGSDKLKAEVMGFPLEVNILSNSDIPECVQDGVVHCDFADENVLVESRAKLIVKQKLSFSHCKLNVAVPRESDDNGQQRLNGKRIATSYANSYNKFLGEYGLGANIQWSNDWVEVAPAHDLADAVCDIGRSGNTLLSAGRIEVEGVLKSEAVMGASEMLSHEANLLLEKLIFRINAGIIARKYSYMLLNCLQEKINNINGIQPDMKSSTLVPLTQGGWFSLHSVVHENDFWNPIDALNANGA